MIIISAVFFISCGPSDPEYFELEEIPERGDPLNYKFKIDWNNSAWGSYLYGHINLHIVPGPDPAPYQTWSVGSTNGQIQSSKTVNNSFSTKNVSGTNYNVKAQFRENYYSTNIIAESNLLTIKVDYSKFRIIQLQMTGDNLWPNFIDATKKIYYYGYNERMKSFGDANTTIDIPNSNNITNLSKEVNFSEFLLLLYWTVEKAGGDITNINGYGLDRDAAIICGVENIPNSMTGLGFTLDNNVHGFASPRGELIPAMAWIRFDKIRLSYTDQWEFVRAVNGTTLHEMGHARGIHGDDPIGGLIPPHGGTNSDKCIMRSPYNVGWFISPVFCYEHLEFLKEITW